MICSLNILLVIEIGVLKSVIIVLMSILAFRSVSNCFIHLFKYIGCLYTPSENMRNAGLEEAQSGIKIAGRNINNFRYADDTILMAESEEELKSLLMKVKGRVKKLA